MAIIVYITYSTFFIHHFNPLFLNRCLWGFSLEDLFAFAFVILLSFFLCLGDFLTFTY